MRQATVPTSLIKTFRTMLTNGLLVLASLVVLQTQLIRPARASVITTGNVVPGGAATQSDPWAVGGSLKVGDSGNGTLNVEAAGLVSNTKGYIGYQSGSTGEATITGTDSHWNNSVELYVGVVGDGTLNVEAGGLVSNTRGYIGYQSGSTGETTVTGTDSHWNNSGELYVGVVSNGTLNVEAEGTVTNTAGYIGYHSGSTGETTVTGPDSHWNNSGSLHVGVVGNGTLNVKAGGVVSNSTGRIGDQSGSTGKATVTGSNSQWNNSDRLVVGRSGDGTLIVEAAGVVSNNLGLIGRYSTSTGVVTITGASSQWNNSGALHVGWYGDGTLNVKAGGMASNISGYIGRYSGSTGVATVTGVDSQWNNSNSLYIGGGSSGAGGSGTLNLNNSGLVTISGTTKLWSDGTIILDGGTLDVGVLDLTLGTFNMLDGRLHADSVVGDINVQGGTVAPGHSPGIMSIFGNYVQGNAATLEMELGGTENGEYDRLLVTGEMTLGGNLEVELIDSFIPQVGDTFDLFSVEPGVDLQGSFSNIELPWINTGLWDSSGLLSSGSISVVPIPEPATLSPLTLGALMLLRRRRR